jgi:solute carrier family 25 (mitochondrial carnitine/acylcarnitine transporter), member 20/29
MLGDGTRDVVAGAFAGACNVVAGHPLDTVKVVLQASSPGQYRGTMHAAKHLGFRGLYRGLPAPLVGGIVETSVNYTCYQAARRSLSPDLGNVASACLAGAGAGVALSVVLSPLELIKCRVQAGVDASVSSAVQRVWRDSGLAGFSRGLSATLARELSGNALFFASYEALQRSVSSTGLSSTGLAAPLCGGLAGVAYWLAVLPVDMAKTRLQVLLPGQPQSEWGIVAILRHELTARGVRAGWYAGAQPVMVRAFVANAAQWAAWDVAQQLLS